MAIPKRIFLLAFILGLFGTHAGAFGATIFYYTSSPESWIGHGETRLITPADGFVFGSTQNAANGYAGIYIEGIAPSILSWDVDFKSPNNAPLSVQTYLNARRYPFQPAGSPGLAFSGNFRANNKLTGEFTIHEISFLPTGKLQTLAADFIQYDEGKLNWWNIGAIRYNSDVPITIPEPSTFVLLCLGSLCLLFTARKYRPGTPAKA